MRSPYPLFTLLASVTKQELARQVAYMKAENRILRARLPQRLGATESERRKLICTGRKLRIYCSSSDVRAFSISLLAAPARRACLFCHSMSKSRPQPTFQNYFRRRQDVGRRG